MSRSHVRRQSLSAIAPSPSPPPAPHPEWWVDHAPPTPPAPPRFRRGLIVALSTVVLLAGALAAVACWPEPDASPVTVPEAPLARLDADPPAPQVDKRAKTLPPAPLRPALPAEAPALAPLLPPLPPRPEEELVVQGPSARLARRTFKRRQEATEAELLSHIARAPELALDTGKSRHESKKRVASGLAATRSSPRSLTTPLFLESRSDLAGLSVRKGQGAQLTTQQAAHLGEASRALRELLNRSSRPRQAANGRAVRRPDAVVLRRLLIEDTQRQARWARRETVPALVQMLMAEEEPLRYVLVELLGRIAGPTAGEALARRALFDLSSGVREQAVEELSRRPSEDYLPVLLDGFRYPWAVIADHAAEAVVALGLEEAVPSLRKFLAEPGPLAPFERPGKGKFVRELVRVNHVKNCLLCHAPSFSEEDKVRGKVPGLDERLLVTTGGGTKGGYKGNQKGPGGGKSQSVTISQWARADITYLKQDFSVTLPVNITRGADRRFDFLVRERPANKRDLEAPVVLDRPTAHQEALRFALRELTGADRDAAPLVVHGPARPAHLRVTAWLPGLRGRALALSRDGRAYVAAGKHVLLQEKGGRASPWVEDHQAAALALDGKGHLLVARPKSTEVMRYELDTRREKVFGRAPDATRFHQPRRLVADAHGGAYLADLGPADKPREPGAVYYITPRGSARQLDVGAIRPTGLALSPDGRTLYVASAGPQVLAYPVEPEGALGRGRTVCTVSRASSPGGVADLAVSPEGHLAVVTTSRRVEWLTASGERIASATLPDVPVAAAFGGANGKGLHVLTRSGSARVTLVR